MSVCGIVIGSLALAWPVLAASILLQPDPLDLAWLSVPDATKTQMRSGFDYHDGNYDSGNLLRVEPEGRSFTNADSIWVLFEAEGPGVMTSLWFTGKSKQGRAWIGGRLNFHFDGEPEPSLSGRLPELIESGMVIPAPLAERSSGGWICYAPIGFGRSLKVTLTDHRDGFAHRQNGRRETIPHLYHQFTWQKLDRPVASTRAADLRSIPAWRRDERGDHRERIVSLVRGERTMVGRWDGQGMLNGLKIRWNDVDPDKVRLRVVADDRTKVDLAVSEFWGFSRRTRPAARFQALLLGVNDEGAYYSHFPMPHRRQLQVELENQGSDGSVRVETIHLGHWPQPEHLPFHAAMVTNRMERGRDLTLLEFTGRGHFVGTILELPDGTLEGDDRFYVDGEPFPPSWHGTGTEDYFRCGWYFFGGALTRPLYGLLDEARPRIAYRFHVADRVNFTRSVVIGFEHGHANQFIGPIRGVVFWYGQGE